MVFPVVMYGRESWTIKETEHQRIDAFELWFWRRLLRVSPLDCKEIQPVHPKGDQSWIFIGRTDVEAEAPILWSPDMKNWLIGKTWCWERLKAGGEEDDRGWDGWMASLTQWTRVWASSESLDKQAWTSKLWEMDRESWSAAVHEVTELDMTERWPKSFSTKRGEEATWAERAKRSMKKESWILETQGKDGECYSVWRISSPKRWGIISPLLSVLFLLGKLGMKGWGRTFDSPSCQSLCWQLLFSPPAISFLPRLPPVQVNELRGSTPAAQWLPSHTWATALGSICCNSGGGNTSPAGREARVRVFTWPKQGWQAAIWSEQFEVSHYCRNWQQTVRSNTGWGLFTTLHSESKD